MWHSRLPVRPTSIGCSQVYRPRVPQSFVAIAQPPGKARSKRCSVACVVTLRRLYHQGIVSPSSCGTDTPPCLLDVLAGPFYNAFSLLGWLLPPVTRLAVPRQGGAAYAGLESDLDGRGRLREGLEVVGETTAHVRSALEAAAWHRCGGANGQQSLGAFTPPGRWRKLGRSPGSGGSMVGRHNVRTVGLSDSTMPAS